MQLDDDLNAVNVPRGTTNLSNAIFDKVNLVLKPESVLNSTFLTCIDTFLQCAEYGTEREINIDELAHGACTSPLNDLPQPTEEQKKNGDYIKGIINIGGIEIHIENPCGSVRTGRTWRNVMKHHYGYISNTMGADGDELDVFVKSGIKKLTDKVYIIRQVDKNGDFDEHKIVLGADSKEEAEQIYLSAYFAGWDGLESIEEINLTKLKSKITHTWTMFDDSAMQFASGNVKITKDNVMQAIDYMLDNSDHLLSDNTNAQNYRWANQGYVAGSKAELAKMFKRHKDSGTTVTYGDIDWQLLKQEPRLAEAMLIKKNLISKVDWTTLKDGGMDSGVAYFIKKLYAQIGEQPLAPMLEESQQNYVTAISNLRQKIESCKTYEDIVQYIVKELWENLRELPPKLLQVYYVSEDDKVKSKISNTVTKLMDYDLRVYAELGDKIYNWLQKTGNKALYEVRTGRNYSSNAPSKGADWSWIEPKEKQAQETPKKAVKKSFQLEHAEHIERVGGKDIKIQSSSELQELLGLRAVQSGNWVLKDKSSAEYHMQATAQAMSDLSDIIGIPTQELGLNGNLAIAFGARGKGGALAHYEPDQKVINITKLKGGGSLGHEFFHAIDNIINDLSTQKVGSITFMGSNDYHQIEDEDLKTAYANLIKAITKKSGFKLKISERYFNRMSSIYADATDEKTALLVGNMIDVTQSKEQVCNEINNVLGKYLENLSDRDKKSLIENIKGQLVNLAIKRLSLGISDLIDNLMVNIPLVEPLNDSDFIQGARELDGNGKKSYWSANHEMTARAFTSYTIDKLEKEGRKNDYLSYEGYHSKNAFPQGAERETIAKAFDGLFKVIRDKQIFKLASENGQLLDDMFGGSTSLDLSNVKQVTKANVIAVIDAMYMHMVQAEIKKINDSDVPMFVTDTEESTADYLKRFNSGEIAVNQATLLQIQGIALELNEEQLGDTLKTAVKSLNATLQNEDSIDLVKYAETLEPKEQVSFLITALAYENNVIGHTTKRGKALNGVVITDISYSAAKELDKYTFKKDGGFFIRKEHLLSIEDNYLNSDQLLVKEVLSYVSNTDSDTPELSAIRGRLGRSGNSTDGRNADNGVVGESEQSVDATGSNGNSSTSVSDDVSASVSSGSNRTDESGNTRAKPNTKSNESDTGTTNGSTGLHIERERDQHAINDAQATRSELELRIEQQKQAPNEVGVWGDQEDIKRTVPLLLPEQHEDVAKIEERLQANSKNGILVTNGTGTGKTFTGLGALKRIVNSGKENILIVVMNDKILRDFVKSGKPLGLDIYPLASTSENGKGHIVSITTFSNLAVNKTLFKRKFDAILVDEAHTLMQSVDGTVTGALQALRGLTGHHAGFNKWFSESYTDQSDSDNEEKKKKYYANREKQLQKWQERWKKQSNLTKVIFLSATPFSYLKCIEWAEGYLFNFVSPETQYNDDSSNSYNGGGDKEKFYINNFGFRMRYNKLTRPKETEFEGANEREFNQNLKDQGALIGRQIKLKFDYDRKFILIDSSIGNLLDEGFSHLDHAGVDINSYTKQRTYSALSTYLRKQFTYTVRRQFLESIKANWLISYIKKQFALNRKVVVFHDYNEGGAVNPFFVGASTIRKSEEGMEGFHGIAEEYAIFKEQRPDLVALKIDFDSAVNIFKSAFPKAMFFSGRISKKQRQENVDLFNDDNSGRNLLIVQSDAGSTGISLHDTTGKFQRVSINIGQPLKPAKLRQTEGRIYRVGQASNAIQRYLTTGTAWERDAFVSTIAGRVGTVDNLSQGLMAKVSIKESLINAYVNADYEEPSENDGIGGKEEDANAERSLDRTPYENALLHYHNKQETKANRNNREGKDWYATPEPIGLKMLNWSGAHAGDKVLEPSAGDGALMRFAPDGMKVTMVEQSSSLASQAQMANTDANVIVGDFLEDHGTNNKYHSIVMNPPFGNGGSDAIKHLKKAFDHLYDNGRVVALVPCGAMDKKVLSWIGENQSVWWQATVKLPSCTFENAGTKVLTQILIFDKLPKGQKNFISEEDFSFRQERAELEFDYSNYTDISVIFDILPELDSKIPSRKPRLDESLKDYGIFVEPDKSNYLISGYGLENKAVKRLVNSFPTGNSFRQTSWYSNHSAELLRKLIDYEKTYNVSLKQQ